VQNHINEQEATARVYIWSLSVELWHSVSSNAVASSRTEGVI